MSDHSRWDDDLAAYLLGSLEPAEAEELERHLDGCEVCREGRSWLGPAIQLLPESVERLDPDPGLRERVLAEVRADAGTRAGRVVPRRRERRRRGIFLRPAIGLAGAAVIIAGIVGYGLAPDGDEPSQTIPGSPSDGRVTANLERKGDSGTLQVVGLTALGPREDYQAWVQRDGRMEPSSLFAPRSNGTASAAIPRHLDGAERVLVTIEPAGGSEEPTSAPLVSVPLPD